MFQVTTTINFCYGHRLLNYDGKCKYLHGHNARVIVTLSGESLDNRGMLVDFGDLKSALKGWIDSELDHQMLLCRDDPLSDLLVDQGERVFLMDENPTAENIARLVFNKTRDLGFPVSEVVVWETENSYATFSG